MAAKRGRKPILEDKTTTCVSVEGKHIEYLQEHGMELSKFVRDSIEALMRFNSSPIEKMKKEVKDRKAVIQENEIAITVLEMEIQKLEEIQANEQEIDKELREFEEKRREYVKGCIDTMRNQSTYNRLWMEYLLDAWKFANFDEAKEYVKNVWLDEGVPEKKLNTYLRLN
jgi:hypothetical protein